MAGRNEEVESVRPRYLDSSCLSRDYICAGSWEVLDEEKEVGEFPGEVCERISLDREEDVVKKVRDPKLPTQI
jgi:hypothetical protein